MVTTRARVERDALGEKSVPLEAYYGIQTVRALENFPVSGLRPAPRAGHRHRPREEVRGGSQSRDRPTAGRGGATPSSPPPTRCCQGQLRDQFVVDVYQAGAGTSHNMNVNEVLANRAEELLGGRRGSYSRVHPNDHVNMSQSTNDVYPTATRLALLTATADLVAEARGLAVALEVKAAAFASVLKVGRTHLQDAVPMTLGQEFGGYAAAIASGADHVETSRAQLLELNLGATAVGTGLNAGDDYTRRGRRSPGARDEVSGRGRAQSIPRHAEHGRRARGLGRRAPPCRRIRQARERSAAARHGPARRAGRGAAAGRAAGLVDHAGQGEPVDPRDGEPGLLPGDRVRRDDRRGVARRASSS